MAVAGLNQDVNWPMVKKEMSAAQSAVDKQDASFLKFKLTQIIEMLPTEEHTYYAGMATGPEIKLVTGKAGTIIGTQYGVRLDRWRRAADEYTGLSHDVKGLAVLLAGKPISGLIELGYEYFMHPGGFYPIYSLTSTLGNVTDLASGTNFVAHHGHKFESYLAKGAVAVPHDMVDVNAMSRTHDVHILHVDHTHKHLGDRGIPHLAIRKHITIRNGEVVYMSGDASDCEECPKKTPDFRAGARGGAQREL